MADLELATIRDVPASREFVCSNPTLVYLPQFVGRVRVSDQPFSFSQGSALFYVPAGNLVVVEVARNSSPAHFVAFFGGTQPKIFNSTPLKAAQGNTFEMDFLIRQLSKGQPKTEALHEAFLRQIDIFFHGSEALPLARRSSEKMFQVFEHIRTQSNCDLSLSDICEDLHLSMSQVSRDFRRYYGVPPYRYWLLLRLCQSRRALRENKPIASVAFDFGFSDQSHYTRLFRRFYKITPLEYQKQVNTSSKKI